MRMLKKLLLLLPLVSVALSGSNLMAQVVDLNAEDLLNLEVKDAGVYQLTHKQLVDFGLDISGEQLNRVALMNRGEPVYIELTGSSADNAVFGPGAKIRFIGKGLDTLYTDTNVYTLRLDSAAQRLIEPESIPLAKRAPYATSYLATKSYAPQTGYTFASANAQDPWYADRILALRKPASKTVNLILDDFVPGGNTGATQAKMMVEAWGGSDLPGTRDDHHMKVRFNGHQVMDETFDGFNKKVMSTPLQNLRAGSNSVSVELPLDQGYEYEAVNLNTVEIQYPRAFVAHENRLSFSSTATKFLIKGFSDKRISVYRQLVDGKVTRLAAAQALGNCNVDRPRCGVRFSSRSGVSNYEVFSIASLKVPNLNYIAGDDDIRSGNAQYLIITHPDFIAGPSETDLLGGLRQSLSSSYGSVDVVDVEQIYAQFGDHIFDPQAIRDYIKFANEQRSTEVVLLVGGDIYDYRGFENQDARSFIPSIYITTGDLINFAPVDAKYVDLDDDDTPDLPIGRLPVRTMSELQTLINKRSAYLSRDYAGQAIFAADKVNALENYSFKLDALTVQQDFFDNWVVDTAFIDDISVGEARSKIINRINQGVSLTSFFGHSSTAQWTFDGMFNGFDAANLNNVNKPTIVTQWGCWNTYYVNPNEDSMGHRFMMEGNRGAVAVMGATTLTSASNEKLLARLVFDRMTKGEPIGAAINNAKADFVEQRSGALDVILGWTLLGFPDLVL